MRRSEVSALRWADVAAEAAGDGVLVTVRRGKTNQGGETKDVWFDRVTAHSGRVGLASELAGVGADEPGVNRRRT